MIDPPAAHKRQRFGLHTRQIGSLSIRRIISPHSAVGCRRMRFLDSIGSMNLAGLLRSHVGLMSDASSMIFMKHINRRSPKMHSDESARYTESSERFVDV